MSHPRTRHNQWGLFLRTVECMNLETKEIVADFLIAVLILTPVFTQNADPAIQGALAAFVHSVHIPRAIRAYRQAKYEVPEPPESG